MFAPILCALLISVSPADVDSASPDPLGISVGDMSFSGNKIQLTKSDNAVFECEIDGHAQFSFGSDDDTEVSIAAQKIVVSRNANSEITIRCTSDCKLTFPDLECSCNADHMQIHFAKQIELQHIKLHMDGNCRAESGTGDNRIAVKCNSMKFQGGKFSVSGIPSITRGE